MTDRFTEQDTQRYYDAEDAIYRSVWDSGGSVHWGIFDHSTGDDFLKACANLNDVMAQRARIDGIARVLDIGCGNGNTAFWMSDSFRCNVTGIDLSGVRVGNAVKRLESQPAGIKELVSFKQGSGAELPFDDSHFTHVWSQATFYHIHDKQAVLREVHRVLRDGGTLVFDDLFKPKREISESARTYVYDRLLFDTDFSFASYQDSLKSCGFRMLDAQDLSEHLKTSYACLEKVARIRADEDREHRDKFQALATAYEETVRAVDNGELGWGLYLCQK
jgi:ubiquinone/menaquinone biosynthesis C-methylase UbiE